VVNKREKDMQKHRKRLIPSDKDLDCNPMIGGSKGAYRAGVKAKELEDSQGVNTIEGDVENDTTAQGGIKKSEARSGSSRR
jgi:hypothetical protein